MGSLRTFHIFFMLVVIAAADAFGIWCVWDYTHRKDPTMLALGVISLLGGLGLIAYAVWFIRKLDRAHIE